MTSLAVVLDIMVLTTGFFAIPTRDWTVQLHIIHGIVIRALAFVLPSQTRHIPIETLAEPTRVLAIDRRVILVEDALTGLHSC